MYYLMDTLYADSEFDRDLRLRRFEPEQSHLYFSCLVGCHLLISVSLNF